MKVLHTYCLNYNIGDYLLGIGVKNLLRKYLNIDLIGETNIQGTVFNEFFIEKTLNKNYDLLVIGGGGIIHGAHWPNGWFWLIDKEMIQKIAIPFIVYGVGYNYFKGESEIPDRGINHLKATIEASAHFSVRNDGSKERLAQQTGIAAEEVPDPGFFAGCDLRSERPIKDPYVVIQLANDKPDFRFGDTSQRSLFIENMRTIVKHIASKFKVVLAPHVYDDVSLSNEVVGGIENCVVWDFKDFAFDRCYLSSPYYKYAEFVLAMRGHAQIVPISFNTPVISLENHPKNRGLMQNLNLMDFNIDIKDQHFVEKLTEMVELTVRDRDRIAMKYGTINLELGEKTRRAFESIREKLQTGK